MANKMLIDATHPEETRVVVSRGNRVEEFDFESAQRKQLRGNIYLAKVTRVEPSLQAAFVDYGGNRHGFLAFSEIHPDYYQIPVADRQALIDEEERAQRDAEAEAEHRAGRRRGSRHRSARRRDASVQSGPIDSPAEDAGEAGTPVIDAAPAEEAPAPDAPSAERSSEDIAEQTPVPTELAAPFEAETMTSPFPSQSIVPSSIDQNNAEEPTPAATESPAVDGGEPDAWAGAGSSTDADGEDHDTDTEDDSHGSEDGNDEEEIVESVGGADALEEVAERMPRIRRQYKIQEVIKRRQVMLVQVVKEERGTKGAALTTYLSLAGRYSVLMPNTARGGGISRKITSAADRGRLKEVAQELEVPEGMGVILRTAGASRTKTEIKRDFEYLLRLWETVRDLTLRSTAPTLVYEEGSLVKRSIRDLYNKDIDEVIVAGDNGFHDAKDFMRMLMPSHAKNVKPYRDSQPIFTRYGIESQLDAMFSPIVQLRSGGYIVVNQTEALVAIDVNSGRATREHHIEDTALKTNLEASEEVARQLRLRDLAGLIVIDFIDMEEKRNNRSVERRLKECLKHDRARIQVGRISHFGLLEMSRQRIRTSVLESSTEKCPHCGGTGHMRSVSSVALQLLRSLEEMLLKGATHNLIVRTRAEVALYVLNHKRAHLRELEQRFQVVLTVNADPTIAGQQSFVIDKGEQVHTLEAAKALAVQPTSVMPRAEEEDEEETEEVVEEAEAEAGDEEEVGETARAEQDGEGRRRRRRRRRGRRGEGREPSLAHEPAAGHAEADHAETSHAETGEVVEAEEVAHEGAEADETEPAFAADAGEDGDTHANGERRRRRRGRRGGRRNRRDRETEGETEQMDFGQGVELRHDEPAPMPADAPQPYLGMPRFEAPPHEEREHEPPAPAAVETQQAASPSAGFEPAPMPVAAPPESPSEPVKRRSTVREPAPVFAAEQSTAVAEKSEPPVEQPDFMPEPVVPSPITVASEDETKPRRTGWWSRRILGGKG